MKCEKCGSLMVAEVFYASPGGGYAESFVGCRCPMCGDVVDPVILEHRAKTKAVYIDPPLRGPANGDQTTTFNMQQPPGTRRAK